MTIPPSRLSIGHGKNFRYIPSPFLLELRRIPTLGKEVIRDLDVDNSDIIMRRGPPPRLHSLPRKHIHTLSCHYSVLLLYCKYHGVDYYSHRTDNQMGPARPADHRKSRSTPSFEILAVIGGGGARVIGGREERERKESCWGGARKFYSGGECMRTQERWRIGWDRIGSLMILLV